MGTHCSSMADGVSGFFSYSPLHQQDVQKCQHSWEENIQWDFKSEITIRLKDKNPRYLDSLEYFHKSNFYMLETFFLKNPSL